MRTHKSPWRLICLLSVVTVGLIIHAGSVLRHYVLNAALIAAVERGKIADAEDLLRQGADVNAGKAWFHGIPPSRKEWRWYYSNLRDEGNTPQPVLCLAADQHDLPMVNLLLTSGADVNARSVHDYTALNYANGDAMLTRVLLQHGADRNAQDSFGDTALPAVPPQILGRAVPRH